MNPSPAPTKLSIQFPEMKEIKNAPSLGSLNGFGTSMAGSRGKDQNTGTFIKTHVLTAVFIPVFALGAYRVAHADGGGWYFLGKEKLSGFAKFWNYLVIISIVAGISFFFYNSHINSADYKAEQSIEQAEQQVADGEIASAMRTYQQAYSLNSSHGDSISKGFSIAAEKGLASDQPETVVKSTQLLLGSPFWNKLKSTFPKLYEDSIEKAQTYDDNPQAALKLINSVRQIAGSDTKWVKVKLQTLEKLAASQSPVDLKVAEELAAMYDELGESEKIIALLSPIQASVKERPAAKTLGSAFLSMGQSAEAIPMLESYLKPRQKDWTEAANKIDATYEREYQAIIDAAQKGAAPESVYKQLDATTDEAKQQQIVQTYVEAELAKGSQYSRYKKTLEKNMQVPDAIMDLGIAHLRVAQIDPAKRTHHLEQAESTLLSMQNYAGESPEYQLFLGQVYYWLGKPTEGKTQFDSVIKSSGNNFEVLMSITNTLRDVGRVTEATELSETAYKKATTKSQKSQAASFRSMVAEDTKTSIEWLEKADQSQPNIIINLNTQKATLALQNNETDKAILLYKKALEGYSQQPINSTTLNNSALVHFSMFRASGEISHYNDGLRKMEQAIKLEPNSSTLCINAADFFFAATAQDLLKDKMEPKLLQQGVAIANVITTANSPEEIDAISEKIKAHPNYKKACQYLDRAVLLAPQSIQVYSIGVRNYGAVSDLPRLKRILAKMRDSKVDTTSYKDSWQKGIDEITIDSLKEDLKKAQDLINTTYASLKTESGKQLIKAKILQLGLSTWDSIPIINIDERIKELRSIDKLQPCSAINTVLREALNTKACMVLSASSPEFTKWVKQSKYQIGDLALLLLWLDHLENPAATISKHPSIKDALLTMHQRSLKFPDKMGPSDWVIAKLVAPEDAPKIAQNIYTDESTKLTMNFSLELASYLPSSTIQKTWQMMTEGKIDEAKAFYKSAQESSELLPKAY